MSSDVFFDILNTLVLHFCCGVRKPIFFDSACSFLLNTTLGETIFHSEAPREILITFPKQKSHFCTNLSFSYKTEVFGVNSRWLPSALIISRRNYSLIIHCITKHFVCIFVSRIIHSNLCNSAMICRTQNDG